MDIREQILSKTNKGLDVFKYYIPTKGWRIGRNFFNPFYNDTNDSFNIYLSKDRGIYLMKDFGNEVYSGDCFDLVGLIYGLGKSQFVDIMRIIDRDLSLSCFELRPKSTPRVQSASKSNAQEPIFQAVPVEYNVKQRAFTDGELSFWNQYGIGSDTLKRYNVVALSRFESKKRTGESYTIRSSVKEPMFGYINDGFIKIYRPFSSIRFLYGGSIGDNYCFGLQQIPSKGDVLYITGGEKDVMSLACRGFNAICFNSESSQISEDIIRRVSFMFKHIVLLYDMDSTGLKSSLRHSQQLSDYNLKRMLLPLPGTKEAKDISDFFGLGYNAEDLRLLFIELLNSLYSNTISILKSCEMNLEKPPKDSNNIISIQGVPLGAEGNLLCITGGEGSGKSNFVGALISGTLNTNNSDIDTLGLTIRANSDNKAILLYDTEQSDAQLYKNSINIIRRSSIDLAPDMFKIYSLVGMARNVRLQAIVESMDSFYHCYKGIHLVVIDGIADLVRCANDESESIAVVEELHRLAGIYNTCIVCVLHLVPNGGKLRGHLGSELQRKASSIISIDRDKDPEVSTIKALKVRDGSALDVPTIMFSWNKDRGMHCYLGQRNKGDKQSQKVEELSLLARQLFNHADRLSYNELCDKIQAYKAIQERAAKSYVSFMLANNIIKKDSANLYEITAL